MWVLCWRRIVATSRPIRFGAYLNCWKESKIITPLLNQAFKTKFDNWRNSLNESMVNFISCWMKCFIGFVVSVKRFHFSRIASTPHTARSWLPAVFLSLDEQLADARTASPVYNPLVGYLFRSDQWICQFSPLYLCRFPAEMENATSSSNWFSGFILMFRFVLLLASLSLVNFLCIRD